MKESSQQHQTITYNTYLKTWIKLHPFTRDYCTVPWAMIVGIWRQINVTVDWLTTTIKYKDSKSLNRKRMSDGGKHTTGREFQSAAVRVDKLFEYLSWNGYNEEMRKCGKVQAISTVLAVFFLRFFLWHINPVEKPKELSALQALF